MARLTTSRGASSAAGVVFLHEAMAVAIDEIGAFAADGFGDEGAAGAGDVEGGGVELDHLHILERCAGTVGHGVTVGGGDAGVGGFAEELSGAAAGDDGALGPDEVDFALDGGERADALALIGEQVDDERHFRDADGFAGFDGVDEGLGEFFAGGVAVGVDDAGEAVTPFEAEGEVVGVAGLFVEVGAPGEEFENALGTFLDDDVDGLGVAEAGAADEGVVDVRFDAVGGLEDGGDAALGVPGVGLVEGVLGEDEDVGAFGSSGNGGAEAGDAAADDQNVRHLLG